MVCRHKQRITISGEELAAADGLLSNEQTILWNRDQEERNARKLIFLRGKPYISHLSLKQQQLMKIVSVLCIL